MMNSKCFQISISAIICLLIHLEAGAESFAELRHAQLRKQFEISQDWLLDQEAPYSADALDAVSWLLKTAYEQGWYQELNPMLSKEELFDALHSRDQKTWVMIDALSQAAAGESESALALLVEQLKSVRIRQPNETLEFVYALSAQLQIAGDYAAAREVYRRTIDAFFLNAQVRTICERRQAKLLLAGEQAPELFTGEWTLSDQTGKFILIDFWATNCAPCLIDLPHLISVSRRYAGDEFQILGISLDTDASFVEEFRQRQRIDWPTPLVETCGPTTREDYRVITIPSTFVVDPEGKIVLVDGQARDVGLLLKKHLK